MIVANLSLYWVGIVVFWYWPAPSWRPVVIAHPWPTLYLGPLKVVTGPGGHVWKCWTNEEAPGICDSCGVQMTNEPGQGHTKSPEGNFCEMCEDP